MPPSAMRAPRPKVRPSPLTTANHTRRTRTDHVAFLQRLLGLIALGTASEAIIYAFLINKVTGLYGFLALFTGYDLNALQLSMYIYSILLLGLGVTLARHIRQGTPLPVLALTWLYVLDTLLSTLYTALFGLGWFKMLATNIARHGSMDNTHGTASLVDTASLASSSKSRVVAAVPNPGSSAGHDPVSPTRPVDPDALSRAVTASGSFASIAVICLLCLVRLVACYVLVTYARECCQRNGEVGSGSGSGQLRQPGSSSANETSGTGLLRQKLGRAMTAFPSRRFWLAAGAAGAGGENDAWLREAGDKFRTDER